MTEGPPKPAIRGVFHAVAFFAALAAGAWLVSVAPGLRPRLACAVYAFSLCWLLGTSALYHGVTWSPAARQRMRRADHAAIFLLIAGTFTPLAFTLDPQGAFWMLVVAWVCAGLGVLRALLWIQAPKWVVAVLALATGWVGMFYLPTVGRLAGPAVLWWMGAGGVLYSTGAIFYALKRPNPWPRTFGYHELFHALVVLAAGCHFVAIRLAHASMHDVNPAF